MARDDSPSTSGPHPGVSQREFVALVAGLMGIGALGVDMMLPALPAIGQGLGVSDANALQYVIAAYTLGFGAGQLIYGPLADRYGRKPVLLYSLAGFVVMSFFAASATSLTMLVTVRAIQGVFGASTRVLVTSFVRDSYSGRTMAKVMSLAQMLFFVVPILAPSLGSLLLLVGPWEWNFWALGLLSAAILVWSTARIPETLAVERRRPISVPLLIEAYRTTLSNRFSLGYALGGTMSFGALMGWIYSSEQIVGSVFGRPDMFPYVFAAIAAMMGAAVFLNSRLVERLGTRKLSHSALLLLIAVAVVHSAVAATGYETLTTFIVLQALQMGTVGLIGSNFSAMAMEPVGHIAGTAASIQGFIINAGGALVGVLIGQAFDGTTLPVALGFALCGCISLTIVLIVERGRLFVPHHPDPRPKP